MFSDAKTVIHVLNASGASLLLTFKSWSDLHFSTGSYYYSAGLLLRDFTKLAILSCFHSVRGDSVREDVAWMPIRFAG